MMNSANDPWIIIYSHEPPYPLIRGSAFRIWELAQALRKHYKVALAVPSKFDADGDFQRGFDKIWLGKSPVTFTVRKAAELKKTPIAPHLRDHPTVATYISELDRFAGNPLVTIDPHAVLLLEEICSVYSPKALIGEYVFSAVPAALIARRHNIFSIIDTHDVLIERRKGEIRAGVPSQFPSDFSEQHEIELLSLPDALIAIQPNEAKILGRLAPHQPIVVAEHPGVAKPGYKPSDNGNIILFIGSASRPDVHGMNLFLTDLWPPICEAVPDAELHVCGIVCDHLSSNSMAQRGVYVHDFCPDLTPYYEKAKIVVNPAQYGSGLKIKSIEALAHGKCLVTTPVGIDGLEEHAGRAFMCVEADQMTQAIIELLNNRSARTNFEKEALNLARQRFTRKSCFQDLINLLAHTQGGYQ